MLGVCEVMKGARETKELVGRLFGFSLALVRAKCK
jgi:hypothetical protein